MQSPSPSFVDFLLLAFDQELVELVRSDETRNARLFPSVGGRKWTAGDVRPDGEVIPADEFTKQLIEDATRLLKAWSFQHALSSVGEATFWSGDSTFLKDEVSSVGEAGLSGYVVTARS